MATNPILDAVKQRDLVPTVATLAASQSWVAIHLHGNKMNPGQTSLPDLMLTREGEMPIMVKCLGPKGDVSGPQQRMLDHYSSVGFRTLSFRPQDAAEIIEVLK